MEDIYRTVTERVLKQLSGGTVPWRKTWNNGLPKSLATGREYRGINLVILAMSHYSSRYWVTYRQAQRLGGQVRKGEKATPIYFWHWRTAEELERLCATTGRQSVAPCTSIVSYAFNLEQIDGIEPPSNELHQQGTNPFVFAENVVEIMPNRPEIVHARTVEPCYSQSTDCITLPHLSQFESGAEYYSTLFHELVHSTGHAKRLNRFVDLAGTKVERYSFEELVAEFGAAFLRGFARIADPTADALSASYIEGWSTVFRQDHRILMRAASAAQKAADYIRGKILPDEQPAVAA